MSMFARFLQNTFTAMKRNSRIFQNLYKTPLFFPSRARYNMNGHTESLTDKKEAAWKN